VTETGRPDRSDGNIDLRAEKDGSLLLLQCKRWAAKPVGVDEIRKMSGTAYGEVRARTGAAVVTLSDFTEVAIEESKRLRVDLVDGRELLERIERVRDSEVCPVCGTPMLLDRSSRGWWLRCPRFPGCSGKRDLAQAPGAAGDLLLRSE